jgi:hypothetical protein
VKSRSFGAHSSNRRLGARKSPFKDVDDRLFHVKQQCSPRIRPLGGGAPVELEAREPCATAPNVRALGCSAYSGRVFGADPLFWARWSNWSPGRVRNRFQRAGARLFHVEL